MQHNGVSVIIPTYNRAALLQQSLLSLTQQQHHALPFEVLVVDDGSSDHTRDVVSQFHDKLDIHYYFQPDQGFRAGQARNMGIQAARYSVCLFLDTGILAPPDLIAQHQRRFQEADQDVLVGLSYGFDEFTVQHRNTLEALYQEHGCPGIFEYLSRAGNSQARAFLDCRYELLTSMVPAFHQCDFPWFVSWTCHLSCTTALLRHIGGFDEHFTTWGGEDFELGIRLKNAGARFDLLTAPMVLHLPHDKPCADRQRSGQQNLKYIAQKHPEIPQALMQLNWTQGILVAKDSVSSLVPGGQHATV